MHGTGEERFNGAVICVSLSNSQCIERRIVIFNKAHNKALAQFVTLFLVILVAAVVSGSEKDSGKMLQLQETLTSKDGMASDTVTAIIEDSKGNLWFGTTSGVSRYDGRSFKNFTTKDGLAGNTVLDVFEDKEGNLWFATHDGGVSRYDGETFHNITSGFAHNERWNNDRSVKAIAQDEAGNLWFGGAGGISRYDGHTFRHFTTDDGLRTGGVKDMLFDKKGVLWIARTGGGGSPLTRYDGHAFDNIPASENLPSSMALTIMQDKKGNIWFGTPLGVSVYDGKTFRSYNEKDGFPQKGLGVTHYEIDGRRFIKGKGVSAILEDRNGTLWFATRGGGVSRGVSESSEISKER